MRDLIIVWSFSVVAIVVVMRKKSLRELLALIAASLVLVVINGLIIYIFKPTDWRWVTLLDLFYWAAVFVSVVFNRLAKPAPRRN